MDFNKSVLFFLHLLFTGVNAKNRCSRLPIKTEPANIGDASPNTCHFPFTYELETGEKRTLTSCVVEEEQKPWCSHSRNIKEINRKSLNHGKTKGWGNCTINMIGGTAKNGSTCYFPFIVNNTHHYQCIKTEDRPLSFSWCKNEESEWGYCALPPMDTCGLAFVKMASSRNISQSVDIEHIQDFEESFQADISDILAITFQRIQKNAIREKRSISRAQCVVYQEEVYIFNSSQVISFPPRSKSQDEVFQAFRCGRYTECISSIEDSDSDINNSYLRYVIPNSDAEFESTVYLIVHYEVNLTVWCTTQSGDLIPPGLNPLPKGNSGDNNNNNNTVYIVIGCAFAGIVVIVVIAAVIIYFSLKRRQNQENENLQKPQDNETVPELEEYCSIDDQHMNGNQPIPKSITRESGYGYIDITDLSTVKYSPVATPTKRSSETVLPNLDNIESCIERKGNIYESDTENLDKENVISEMKEKENSSSCNCPDKETVVPYSDKSKYKIGEDGKSSSEIRYSCGSGMVMLENDVYDITTEDLRLRDSSLIMQDNDVYDSESNEPKEETRREAMTQDNDSESLDGPREEDAGGMVMQYSGSNVPKGKAENEVIMQVNDVHDWESNGQKDESERKVMMQDNDLDNCESTGRKEKTEKTVMMQDNDAQECV